MCGLALGALPLRLAQAVIAGQQRRGVHGPAFVPDALCGERHARGACRARSLRYKKAAGRPAVLIIAQRRAVTNKKQRLFAIRRKIRQAGDAARGIRQQAAAR